MCSVYIASLVCSDEYHGMLVCVCVCVCPVLAELEGLANDDTTQSKKSLKVSSGAKYVFSFI